MERREPALIGDERTQLTQFLDWQRGTLLMKVAGLDRDELACTTAASQLTLAGLLNHMAATEDYWFRRILQGADPADWYRDVDRAGDPDWDFHSAVDEEPGTLVARYQDACERSRRAVAAYDSLDDVAARSDGYRPHFNLRWILIHMIEETARHNGHADLLREAIDGAAGE